MTERTHNLHDYQTLEPDWLAKHQPRTIEHQVTNPENDYSLSLMSEIGDGVFVAWATCRRCGTGYTKCACTAGPQEPEYVTRWRTERWAKSFDSRPEFRGVRGDLIPTVIDELRARGYTVTPPLEFTDPPNIDDLAIPDLTDEERDGLMEALEEIHEDKTHPPHLPPTDGAGRDIDDLELPAQEEVK